MPTPTETVITNIVREESKRVEPQPSEEQIKELGHTIHARNTGDLQKLAAIIKDWMDKHNLHAKAS